MASSAAERRRWFRLRANNLAERLPAGSYAAAAYAGLQDSSPRAALVALHARVEDVPPDAWEHQSLVQTWAPRGAVTVVAAADLGVFARGIWPRHGGGPPPFERLAVARDGRPIRWDARTTEVLPPVELTIDPEEARLELGRRFLRSLGPSNPAGFCRWAAVTPADACETFAALAQELAEVDGGTVLAADAVAYETAEPVTGVRLVPWGGDPVLQPGDDAVSDLRPVAGRAPCRCSPLRRLGSADLEAVEREALTLPIPSVALHVTWA